MFDSGINVEGQPQPLQVLVAGDGATVQGTVESKDRLMPNATVVLAPPDSRRLNAAIYKIAVTDDSGKFTMRGVAPGNYTVFAWQDIVTGAWQNAEFLVKYRSQGKAVSATPQGTVDLKLELIPSP